MFDDVFQVTLCPSDRQREADILRTEDNGGVNADNLAFKINERPTGVPLVDGNIGLDDSAELLHVSAGCTTQ